MTAWPLRAGWRERVVVVEPGEGRRERIEALGFDGACRWMGCTRRCSAALGGELPAAVFECAGHPGRARAGAGAGAQRRHRGRRGVLEEPVPINQLLLILKEARIQGAFAYRREDFERAIELLASGEVPAAELITESFRCAAPRRCSRSYPARDRAAQGAAASPDDLGRLGLGPRNRGVSPSAVLAAVLAVFVDRDLDRGRGGDREDGADDPEQGASRRAPRPGPRRGRSRSRASGSAAGSGSSRTAGRRSRTRPR